MEKLKKNAVLLSAITLVSILALAVTAFFWAASFEAQEPNPVVSFLFRFFFIVTPIMGLNTLISVIRIKKQGE